MSFDVPPNLPEKKSELEHWWKVSNRLSQGTLACLMLGSAGGADRQLVVAVIASRDVAKLAPKSELRRPCIGLR